MSRDTVMDMYLERHAIVICDKCGDKWTEAVCRMCEWLLSNEKDLCERCKPAPRSKRRAR